MNEILPHSLTLSVQAFQLIKAVSVLLHFTKDEEDMLKQTLEYKVCKINKLKYDGGQPVESQLAFFSTLIIPGTVLPRTLELTRPLC